MDQDLFCEECNDRTWCTCCHGQYTCTECGMVVSTKQIDKNAEWRNFESSKDNSRCTEVNQMYNGLGPTLANHKNKRMNTIEKWSQFTSSDRALYAMYEEMSQMCVKCGFENGISKVMCDLYFGLHQRIQERPGVKKAHVREGIKAACLFFALRQIGRPYERKEISEMTGVSQKVLTRGYNLFMDMMGPQFQHMPPLTSVDFLERFWILAESCVVTCCDQFTIKNWHMAFDKTRDILLQVEKQRLFPTMNPPTITVAVVACTLEKIIGQVPSDFILNSKVSIANVKKVVEKLKMTIDFN